MVPLGYKQYASRCNGRVQEMITREENDYDEKQKENLGLDGDGSKAAFLHAIPVSADQVARIQCGDQVYGTLDSTGTLVISGTGDMWDSESSSMFRSYAESIYRVVIEDD